MRDESGVTSRQRQWEMWRLGCSGGSIICSDREGVGGIVTSGDVAWFCG